MATQIWLSFLKDKTQNDNKNKTLKQNNKDLKDLIKYGCDYIKWYNLAYKVIM